MANSRYTYNIREYGAHGDDVADDYSPLYIVIQLIGSTASEIYFPPGTYIIGTTISIPSNITINLAGGAILAPTSGKTLTILGALTHANTTYTGGAGTVTVATQTFAIDALVAITATITTLNATTITVPVGTVTAPSFRFVDANLGFYRVAAGFLGFAISTSTPILFGGSQLTVGSSVSVGWSSGDPAAAAMDALFVRDATQTIAQKNGTNAQHFRVYGTTTGSKYTEITHDGVSGIFNVITGGGGIAYQTDGATRMTLTSAAALVLPNVAIPAGGTTGTGILLSSTANFGIHFGSNVPTLSAAKGSLYLRSDGASNVTRAYINTDGGTTWTAINTVA